jgi:hypothetical protein
LTRDDGMTPCLDRWVIGPVVGGTLAPYGFGVPFFVISVLAVAFMPIAWLSLPRDGAVPLLLWLICTIQLLVLPALLYMCRCRPRHPLRGTNRVLT